MSKPKNQNRTFHLLGKADILTCYEHCAIRESRDGLFPKFFAR
jgi:hypothetical protein